MSPPAGQARCSALYRGRGVPEAILRKLSCRPGQWARGTYLASLWHARHCCRREDARYLLCVPAVSLGVGLGRVARPSAFPAEADTIHLPQRIGPEECRDVPMSGFLHSGLPRALPHHPLNIARIARRFVGRRRDVLEVPNNIPFLSPAPAGQLNWALFAHSKVLSLAPLSCFTTACSCQRRGHATRGASPRRAGSRPIGTVCGRRRSSGGGAESLPAERLRPKRVAAATGLAGRGEQEEQKGLKIRSSIDVDQRDL